MIRSFCLLLLLAPACVFAQSKVGKTRDDVKRELETWASVNSHYQPKISDKDSITTLFIKDPGYGDVKFQYSFGKDSVCMSEKTITTCDSCRRNYLNAVLEQGGYQWRRLNGNQYVSKFSDHLMIEMPPGEKDYSFTIFYAQWTKQGYDMLFSN